MMFKVTLYKQVALKGVAVEDDANIESKKNILKEITAKEAQVTAKSIIDEIINSIRERDRLIPVHTLHLSPQYRSEFYAPYFHVIDVVQLCDEADSWSVYCYNIECKSKTLILCIVTQIGVEYKDTNLCIGSIFINLCNELLVVYQ